METKTFTEIEAVNRLHLSRYRLDTKGGVASDIQRMKERIVFCGDRGEPESYRAEIAFKTVLYLSCPFHLVGHVHWRLAKPNESRTVFPANTIFESGVKSDRQKSQVYCLEVEASADRHEPPSSLNSKEEPSPLSQPAHRTFFIVADAVEIVVHYQGGDLDAYMEQLQHETFPGQVERN